MRRMLVPVYIAVKLLTRKVRSRMNGSKPPIPITGRMLRILPALQTANRKEPALYVSMRRPGKQRLNHLRIKREI